MFHIQPRQTADLPPRTKSFWQMTGPSAVLVGLSIGAGEIIIWPTITARYGAGMLWAAALGVILQLIVNIEIGRWTIATGETPYTAFSRVWGAFAILFVLFNFFGWYFPGWAQASGAALKALVTQDPDHGSPTWLWTLITFAGVAAVLFGPKFVYAAVEKFVMVLVFTITVGLIYIALRVGTWDLVKELFGGILNVGYKHEDMPTRELFSALVFAGAGGTSNLFYAFYLRDKQLGMGSRIPVIVNPFRGEEQAEQGVGFLYPETSANQANFRSWMRYIRCDQVVFFWILNTLTMFLFIFGSLAVLHPQGIIPEKGRLIWDEALILAHSLGPAGRYLFLIIGVATLFSTQVTLVDGVSRSMADIFHTTFGWARRWTTSQWYVGAAIFMMLFGVAVTVVLEYTEGMKDLGVLFTAAYIGGFAMAVYTPMLIYINCRHLPVSARPGVLSILAMVIAAAIYVGFAVMSLWGQFIG